MSSEPTAVAACSALPSVAVPARADGTLRLAVVADTHSRVDAAGLAQLHALAPQAILHAGDVGARHALEALEAIAPVHVVRGNIDGRSSAWPEALLVRLTDGATPVLTLLLTHVALAGPHLRAAVAQQARNAGASLVVCGHSHVPFLGVSRGLTVFNPGSIGPRRFALPIVFGVLELDRVQVRLRHVDAQTGAPWCPPSGPP